MANRLSNGSGGAAAVTVREALELETPIFVPDAPPSVEDRLAAFEAELERNRAVIRTQALTIAVGVENAERLRKSREGLTKLEARWHDAKKAAADAKKSYEAGVASHFELENDLDSPQGRLPFPPESEAAPPPADRDDDGDWRAVPLGRLGIADELPVSLVSLLADARLITVGDLSDFVKPSATGSCRALTDIPGIGAAKAERIERALDDFWQSRAVDLPGAGNPEWTMSLTSILPGAAAEVRAGVEEVEAGRARVASDADDDPDDDGEANGSDRDEDEDELGFELEEEIVDDESVEYGPDDEP